MSFTLDERWLSMNAYICALPESTQAKWRLAEALLRYNDKLCALKYTLHDDSVTLDVQCRAEHVDPRSVEGYFGLLLSAANEHYPNLMRELTGEKILESLGKQLQTQTA